MKAARKKGVVIEGAPIRFSADVPAETLQARREWEDICKVLKEKKQPTKNTIPGKTVLQK